MSENKDYLTQAREFGSINISEEVISSIAALAIDEVDGVAGLSASAGEELAGMLGRKNVTKGIRLTLDEQNVHVECYVIVLYGYAIPEVSASIQDSVTSAVESMTGLHVEEVNVNVTGISMAKKEK